MHHNPDLFDWLFSYAPSKTRKRRITIPKHERSKPRHRRPWQRFTHVRNVYRFA